MVEDVTVSSNTNELGSKQSKPHISEYWDRPGLAVLRRDPHLLGWVKHLEARQQRFASALSKISSSHGGLKTFTDFNRRGFSLDSASGSVTYTEYAPNAMAMSFIGEFNGFDPNACRMQRSKDPADPVGVWTVTVVSSESGVLPIPVGSEVAVLVTPNPTEVMPNPKVLKRIPAQILHATQTRGETFYRGRMADVPRIFPSAGYQGGLVQPSARPSRPTKRSSERVYEAHIGVAIGDDSGIGTFAEFQANVLPRVASGGYKTLQLMGIAEHPYYPSFGYQVSNFFAPSSRFGTMSDLINLIDAAHTLDIRVILDLVHGHASSNEGEGLNRFDGTETAGYFKHKWHPEWKTRLFDYSKPEVLRFLLCNLRFWVERVGFDGFRFDSVTSSLFHDHGLNRGFSGNYDEYFGEAVDEDAVTYFQLANHFLEEMFPGEITTIAEDVSGYPTLCCPVSQGGLGFDFRLALGNPDMWFKLLRENSDMAQLPANALTNILQSLMGRRAHLGEKSIAYVECHDQCIGGHKTVAHWLFDNDIYSQMSKSVEETERVRVGMRWHKLMRFLTHTLGGEGYLDFMGNEFGHPEWLDFPAPRNHYSHAHAHRKWHLSDDPSLRFNQLLAFDKALNAKEEESKWLDAQPADILLHDEALRLIVYTRAGLLFAINLHSTDPSTAAIPSKWSGPYFNLLDTDEGWYGGKSEASRFGIEGIPVAPSIKSKYPYCLNIYIPPLTGMILKPLHTVETSLPPPA